MEFQYYLDNNLARKERPDRGEAESLMRKAEGRLEFAIKSRKIDEQTAPYIFEDIYECMREASQSLMSLRGYKPYSHEALISFLREFFSFPESDISAFDRYRILRNRAVYRAERISAGTCNDALGFLLRFLPKLKSEFRRLA